MPRTSCTTIPGTIAVELENGANVQGWRVLAESFPKLASRTCVKMAMKACMLSLPFFVGSFFAVANV